MANKLLGQHFLQDQSVTKKIVAAIDPRKGEIIIEIGPGHGELTLPLAEACAKVGATIIAIEKDEKLAEGLRAKGIDVVSGDALSVFKSQDADIASGRPYKLVGNIPYYITGHLLRLVGELQAKPEFCVFMIQQEVAERICATPPKMNRLAASIQFWAEPKIIAHVPKTDFLPPPKVDSAVIILATQPKSDNAPHYYATVRALFAQPRKTILNNLASGGKSKDDFLKSLAKISIDPALRPQNLTIEDIRAIADVCG